ncbi:MAG TPA: hypothetical protein VE871_21140, partial [Longimicrobium sp.]|nr:hypothetical protein [Longimicrobium sp.]
MIVRFHLPLFAVIAAVAAAGPAGAQDTHDHPHGSAERLGRVVFPTSCNAAAQPLVERGVAMLHSFWFEQAERTFAQASAADPACAMAQWGAAMTLLGNPYTGVAPAEPRQRAALASAETAVRLAAGATERERGYADAALALFRDFATVGYRVRLRMHEEAMRRVREAAPDDPEAAIFYARAVIANALPTDLTFARQRLAAGILGPLFAKQPDHPGLAHYTIHAYDAPAMAQHGLEAARRYAGIAPSAPHALHMPSHI